MQYAQNAPKKAVNNTKFLFCSLVLCPTSFSNASLQLCLWKAGISVQMEQNKELEHCKENLKGSEAKLSLCSTVCRMSRCPAFLAVQLGRWSQKCWAQSSAVLYGTGWYLCRGAEIHWQHCFPPSFDLQNHHNFPMMLQMTMCITNLSLWTKGLLFLGSFCRPFRSNTQSSALEITPWRNVKDIKEKGNMLWCFFLLKKPSLAMTEAATSSSACCPKWPSKGASLCMCYSGSFWRLYFHFGIEN